MEGLGWCFGEGDMMSEFCFDHVWFEVPLDLQMEKTRRSRRKSLDT